VAREIEINSSLNLALPGENLRVAFEPLERLVLRHTLSQSRVDSSQGLVGTRSPLFSYVNVLTLERQKYQNSRQLHPMHKANFANLRQTISVTY
jgi:hypothetical protein